MAAFRSDFTTAYEDAQRESGFQYHLSDHSLAKRLLDASGISDWERTLLLGNVAFDYNRLRDIDTFLKRRKTYTYIYPLNNRRGLSNYKVVTMYEA